MKKIILTIICVVLMLCIFAGCSSGTANADTEDRMMLIDHSFLTGIEAYVLVDRETGATYLAIYNGGTTVMVDEHGNPLIYNK